MTNRQDDSGEDYVSMLETMRDAWGRDPNSLQYHALRAAIAALSQGSVPAGVGDWVLVPREPTAEMLAALTGLRIPTRLDVWRAMVAATPAPAQQAVTDEIVTRALDGALPNGHRVWAYVACANPDPNVTGREVMRAALEAIAGEKP